MAFNFPEWQSTWIEAVAKAWKDDAFRQELLADPRTAIRVHLNVELDGGFDIDVVEDDDMSLPLFRKAQIVIPPKPVNSDLEADRLSEFAQQMMVGRSTICMC